MWAQVNGSSSAKFLPLVPGPRHWTQGSIYRSCPFLACGTQMSDTVLSHQQNIRKDLPFIAFQTCLADSEISCSPTHPELHPISLLPCQQNQTALLLCCPGPFLFLLGPARHQFSFFFSGSSSFYISLGLCLQNPNSPLLTAPTFITAMADWHPPRHPAYRPLLLTQPCWALHPSLEAIFIRGSLGRTGSAPGGHGFWPSGLCQVFPSACPRPFQPALRYPEKAPFRVLGQSPRTSASLTPDPGMFPNRCPESTEVWWVMQEGGQEGMTCLLLRKQL